MARNVFISILGTNNYLQTHYALDGKISKPVRFVQDALIDFICKDWTENDRVIIFYTEESKKKNWLDNGQVRFHEDEELEKIGLKHILENKNLKPQIEDHKIPEGFSEDEIWGIFNCIYNYLQEEDRIHFDVTHAFRSIPLFSTVLFNYAQYMKQTTTFSIYYGAFETLGPVPEVKSMLLKDRIAPIIDLTSLINLQNITIAASDFTQFGKMGSFAGMIDGGKKGAAAQAIQRIKKALSELDYYIATCRMYELREGKYMKTIHELFETAFQSNRLLQAEKELLEKIKRNLDVFKPYETEDNIDAAVNWALTYGMLQQAYTMGQELVITKVCTLLKEENPSMKDTDYRKYISAILGISEKDVSDKNFKGNLKEFQGLTNRLLALEWIKMIRKPYGNLAGNRNIINHGKRASVHLEKQFRKDYSEIKAILEQWGDES